MSSLKRTARLAGLYYLILAISGAYGIMYVTSQIIVRGDAAATTSNILQHEFLFRTGIFANLLCQTMFIFLALKLYQLFKEVNGHLARTLVALVIVSVPISFLIIFNQIFALLLLKETFMSALPPEQLNALAMASLRMYDYGTVVIGIFWGLWLIPFGLLAYRSGFMPKIIGILLVVGGISYLIDASAFVLYPSFRTWTAQLVAIFSAIAELSSVVWLLAVGVKEKK